MAATEDETGLSPAAERGINKYLRGYAVAAISALVVLNGALGLWFYGAVQSSFALARENAIEEAKDAAAKSAQDELTGEKQIFGIYAQQMDAMEKSASQTRDILIQTAAQVQVKAEENRDTLQQLQAKLAQYQQDADTLDKRDIDLNKRFDDIASQFQDPKDIRMLVAELHATKVDLAGRLAENPSFLKVVGSTLAALEDHVLIGNVGVGSDAAFTEPKQSTVYPQLRFETQKVTFPAGSFRSAPTVLAALQRVVAHGVSAARCYVQVDQSKVTTNGFDLDFYVWNDVQVEQMGAVWIAVPNPLAATQGPPSSAPAP